MKTDRTARLLVWFAVAAGVLLQAVRIGSVKAGRSWSDPFDLLVLAWNIAPFSVLLALPRLVRSRAETIGGVVALLIPELGSGIYELRHYVDPLGLLFAPFWFLLFPALGVYAVRLGGWVTRRAHRGGPQA
jgi:hypothetical protein